MTLFLFVLFFYPVCLLVLDSLLRMIYIFFSIYKKRQAKVVNVINHRYKKKIFFLVVARNEEKVIEQTLNVLNMATQPMPTCTIGVICDRCTDNTEKIARIYGAKVFTRTAGPNGKGPAISWFIENYADAWEDDDIIVILDADSLVDVDFCQNIQRHFYQGHVAVQSFIQPVFSDSSPASTMASYSELLSLQVDDAVRSQIGWSVPLRGTGMAFSGRAFREYCVGLQTQVEDIEISMRLAANKIRVYFEPTAIIYDTKSAQLFGLARQRGRWLRGQRLVLRLMAHKARDVIFSGLGGLSLLQALLFKPKTLLLFIKIILMTVAIFYAEQTLLSKALVHIVLISLLIDMVYYLIGLRYVNNRRLYLSMMLKSPLYILLWFVSWYFSISSRLDWLRARK